MGGRNDDCRCYALDEQIFFVLVYALDIFHSETGGGGVGGIVQPGMCEVLGPIPSTDEQKSLLNLVM